MQNRGNGQPAGSHVLDRLLAEGRIEAAERERALAHAQRAGIHAEDALVDLGTMSEADLLKYLASTYGTRFVGTRKLARASIDAALLRMVPVKAAESLMVCPILYDRGSGTLSIVAADLATSDVAKEVQMVSGAREVRAYVAMPAAVDAAIRKHYHGDVTAFVNLEPPSTPAADWSAPFVGYEPTFGAGAAESYDPSSLPVPSLGSQPSPPAQSTAIGSPSAAAGVPWSTFLESVNVLTALLEQDRGELRGHSAMVARLCRKLGQRLGLADDRLEPVLLAAYLHDVGKASSYHLTGLNVAHYEGHRVQAENSYETPVRLFDMVRLPEDAVGALEHMYERVDGGGFPGKLRGKDIPLGARMLAVVESYADLIGNSKNPFRRRLDPKEACDALEPHRGTVFDDAVLDALRHEVLGDDLRARLLADRHKVLLVDPDAEDTTVLEMRLMEHGHEVAIARTTTDALARLEQGDVDIVISEVDVPPDGGFALARALHDREAVPVLFLTHHGDRESVSRGFELGAADYLVKPASAELVVTKTEQIFGGHRRQGPARGVTGSLREMALPDVVQILANGRKSGRLAIRGQGVRGEVWFGEGDIYDARLGELEGEVAFYHMLKLTDGDFELDPTLSPERRTIHHPCEALLLEGMRRLDEGEV